MPKLQTTINALKGTIRFVESHSVVTLACDDSFVQMLKDALALLKGKELPTELKQKMWNALYAVEDEYEKQFVGTDEHDAWFNTFRPWLQKGFDIAIKTIADWEGR